MNIGFSPLLPITAGDHISSLLNGPPRRARALADRRRQLWAISAFAVVLLAFGAAAARAQEGEYVLDASEPPVPEKSGKVIYAYRLNGQALQLDGRLDDPVWALADSLDDLVQHEPDNMASPTERTVIRILYDDRYIYVGVQCYERDLSQIATGVGRRDDFPPSDRIFIGFDPRHDHLTGYVFQTNPSGVQGEIAMFDDERSDSDYDAVWEVRTQISEVGWSAEFQIPFSQMRFDVPKGDQAVWGFEVRRDIFRRGEFSQWIGRPRGDRGRVSRWGHLVFAEGLSPPRRVEIMPFTLSRRLDLAEGAPVDYGLDAGLDLRLGLGPSTTLSGTFNPDFGQVELDPAVLNLTVFETFFPEKRPFFLEDSRTFVPPYELFQLFHSKRIGRRPDRFALRETDQLVERPEQTTILGATKLTGKASGWTYGALTALTAREYATVDSAFADEAGEETLTRTDRLIEPLTSYNVVRLQRDILGGSSNLGLIGTGVIRERDQDAFTGGVDYKIRWDRNRFQWNGHWVATRAPGPGGVKTGFGGVSNFRYESKYWGFFAHFDHFGPDFRVTDLGFFRSRVDRTSIWTGFNLGQPDPWGPFREVRVWMDGGQDWNGDGLVFARGITVGGGVEFRNFWTAVVNVSHRFEILDDVDTRGGPPIVGPAANQVGFFINSDSRKSWQLDLDLIGQRDAVDGWVIRLAPGIEFKPSSQLQAEAKVNYLFGRTAAQWITNEDVTADGDVDHVYGTLRRDILDVTLRGTYALHRDLTLQLFLQPFVAVGDYTEIRRLARPRSFEFEPISLDFNPDFNRKSLRGNVVLRWEYMRGSTLFLVWNLSTQDAARPGRFSPFKDLGDSFGADGDHVLMVKASYWLGL